MKQFWRSLLSALKIVLVILLVAAAAGSVLFAWNYLHRQQPEVIEPAARKVHMISEKIEAPENAPADGETNNEDKPSSGEAPSDGEPEPKQENDAKSE